MGHIEDFVHRYAKEYDFYDRAARMVLEKLDTNLKAAGVRCIVTHRAKSVSRLADKCNQRDRKRGGYSSVEEIFDDIVDLAGVRVALYFPGDDDQVDKLVYRLFQVEQRRTFPDKDATKPEKRFSGYSAVHYRVYLKDEELSASEKRYTQARVEIQVASVLMHAWSEVEHDLDYKPLEGELSVEEYELLDQLNGLVMAGEIALEALQRAAKARVASTERKFLNHYEVAAHLLNKASIDRPIEDSGLGRVDVLFKLLSKLELDTPAQLDPFLAALHDNLEERPLSDQVIDALLFDNPDRYSIIDSVYGQVAKHPGERHRQIGAFLESWGRLESLFRDNASADKARRSIPLWQILYSLGLPDSVIGEFEFIRVVRNRIVHGDPNVPTADLEVLTKAVDKIIEAIKERGFPEP